MANFEVRFFTFAYAERHNTYYATLVQVGVKNEGGFCVTELGHGVRAMAIPIEDARGPKLPEKL